MLTRRTTHAADTFACTGRGPRPGSARRRLGGSDPLRRADTIWTPRAWLPLAATRLWIQEMATSARRASTAVRIRSGPPALARTDFDVLMVGENARTTAPRLALSCHHADRHRQLRQ